MTAALRHATIVPDAVDEDAELYARWTKGERGAGEQLIERNLDRVGRFLANKCPDSALLEDMVATTFERCAKSLGRFDGRSTFRTYLLGIAYNVARDALKRQARTPAFDETVTSVASVSSSPSAVVAVRQEQALLLAALRQLPFALQAVLELHFFEDLSRSETAALLELPPGTVASRLRRAKTELRAALDSLAQDPKLHASTITKLDDWLAELRARLGVA